MPGDIQLGDNYSIEEDINNNLVITHIPSGSTLTFDSVGDLFKFAAEARFGNPLTDTSGKTIYDPATSTIGDGTTSADHQLVSTDDAVINSSLDATDLTQGSPSSPKEYLSHSNGGVETKTIQQTSHTEITGDNTAQDLFSFGDDYSGLFVVTGQDVGGPGGWFVDLLLVAGNSEIINFQSKTRGSPGARTYSQDLSILQVAIDEAGVTYDVGVTSIAGQANP